MSAVGDRYLTLMRAALTDTVHGPCRADEEGWATHTDTMIGLARLGHLHACALDVFAANVPGDLVECGVWRGGACIYLRAMLAAYEEHDRTVWVCDSFDGLPVPDQRWPADVGDLHSTIEKLRVPLDDVRSRFAKYDLLDDQVEFVAGFFAETMKTPPMERIALLRLDCDMYGSTWEVLDALYPLMSSGGYVICDDWELLAARTAILDYRRVHDIDAPIVTLDCDGRPQSEARWQVQ